MPGMQQSGVRPSGVTSAFVDDPRPVNARSLTVWIASIPTVRA
jgi:hypothetical protein